MSNLLSLLEKIQSRLGEQYIEIGENFNNLVGEMERSMKSGRDIVDDFKEQVAKPSSTSITGRIEEIKFLVAKEADNHRLLKDESTVLVNRLVDIYKELEEVHTPIESIQDSADLMTLLAINSMVVAIQVGSKGGGFTCITEELKTASTSTHQYAMEIDEIGKRVYNGFERFNTLTKEIQNHELTVEKFLEDAMPLAFSTFHEAVEKFIEHLEIMAGGADRIRPTLMGIMQSLQNQDIIRQSMDHILLSLSELESGEFSGGMDDAGFIILKQQLFTLSRNVLQDVRKWLEIDLENLNTRMIECDQVLASLNSEKENLFVEDSDEPGLFRRISDQLGRFKENVGEILKKTEITRTMRKELFKENEHLLSVVTQLKPQINGLSDLVDLFRNINVMARIETARSDVFGNIEASIDEMVGINNLIESAVTDIMNVETFIHSSSAKNVKTFQSIIQQDTHFVETFRDDINNLLSITEESMTILRNSLAGFDVLSGGFIGRFNDTRLQIAGIEDCYKEILELDEKFKNELDSLYAQVDGKGITDEEREENRLRMEKILEKFTIFRHKKHAGDLTGLKLSEETSLEESSIVLF
ncbi:MAG: hypothetical protein JEY99_03650 [Spirochaetales bacterium]|nr:hypothetical protein [Spirochaetales bacterium]